MVKISPSVLSADFLDLEKDIRKLEAAGVDMLHLDVMVILFQIFLLVLQLLILLENIPIYL